MSNCEEIIGLECNIEAIMDNLEMATNGAITMPSRTQEKFSSDQSDDMDTTLKRARDVVDDLSAMVEEMKNRLDQSLPPLEEIQHAAAETMQMLREHATSAKSVAARGNDWTSIIAIIAVTSLASFIIYWTYKCFSRVSRGRISSHGRSAKQ